MGVGPLTPRRRYRRDLDGGEEEIGMGGGREGAVACSASKAFVVATQSATGRSWESGKAVGGGGG